MLLPDARLAVIAGAGHMGPLTHTEEVNAIIIQHLAGVELRDGHPQLHAALSTEDHRQFLAAGAAP